MVSDMWIILFLLALAFVLGTALVLLRTAKLPKIPDGDKAQPYDKEHSGDW